MCRVDPVVIAIVGGSVAAAIAAAVRARRVAKEADAAWAAAAATLGGTYTPRRWHRLRHEPRVITAVVDEVPVRLDHYEVNDGSSQQTYTRARAEHAVAVALGLSITPRGFLRNLAVAFGAGDLETGDPAFDEKASVKRQDPTLIRAWLDAPARAAFLAAPTVAIAVKDGALTTVRDGLLLESARLVELARYLATVAGGGARLVARWRAAADALDGALQLVGRDWPADGKIAITCSHAGRPAAIKAWRHAGATAVLVTLEPRARGARRITVYAAGEAPHGHDATPPEVAEPRLPAGARVVASTAADVAALPDRWFVAFAQVAPRFVGRQDDGSIVALLEGVEPDVARWEAALALCAGLLEDDRAPFR